MQFEEGARVTNDILQALMTTRVYGLGKKLEKYRFLLVFMQALIASFEDDEPDTSDNVRTHALNVITAGLAEEEIVTAGEAVEPDPDEYDDEDPESFSEEEVDEDDEENSY